MGAIVVGGVSKGGVAVGGTSRGEVTIGDVATGGRATNDVTTGGVSTGAVAIKDVPMGDVSAGGISTGDEATTDVLMGAISMGGISTGAVAIKDVPMGDISAGGISTGDEATTDVPMGAVCVGAISIAHTDVPTTAGTSSVTILGQPCPAGTSVGPFGDPWGATTAVPVDAHPGCLGDRDLGAISRHVLENKVHDVGGKVLGGGWPRRWPRWWPVPLSPLSLVPAVIHPVQLVDVGQGEGTRGRRFPRHHRTGETVVTPAGATTGGATTTLLVLAAVTHRCPRGTQESGGQGQFGDVQLIQGQVRATRRGQ